MWLADFASLVLLVSAGFQLGLQAIFGVDMVAAVFGAGIGTRIVFDLMGASAVWQLFRQCFN